MTVKKYVLDTYTTVYGDWPEGRDEPEVLDSSEGTEVFTHLSEVAEWLDIKGLTSPSESPRFGGQTWLSLADGTQVHGSHGHYTGKTEAVTAHNATGFTEREWVSVLNRVTYGSGYRTFTTWSRWRVTYFGAKGTGTAHHVENPARVVTFRVVDDWLVLFRTEDAVPHHLISSVQKWVTDHA
ncbi:hypothetical protein [Umezawaea sp. NPDC059074]|uniref:hypothetical protein n=1 Tax=Umezawaea sp. NPDC059074 TaxID=3346716 RepID=UPI00368817B4